MRPRQAPAGRARGRQFTGDAITAAGRRWRDRIRRRPA